MYIFPQYKTPLHPKEPVAHLLLKKRKVLKFYNNSIINSITHFFLEFIVSKLTVFNSKIT